MSISELAGPVAMLSPFARTPPFGNPTMLHTPYRAIPIGRLRAVRSAETARKRLADTLFDRMAGLGRADPIDLLAKQEEHQDRNESAREHEAAHHREDDRQRERHKQRLGRS